nr:MAG TPA: hypothetical protein [Microviridae sp.]
MRLWTRDRRIREDNSDLLRTQLGASHNYKVLGERLININV